MLTEIEVSTQTAVGTKRVIDVPDELHEVIRALQGPYFFQASAYQFHSDRIRFDSIVHNGAAIKMDWSAPTEEKRFTGLDWQEQEVGSWPYLVYFAAKWIREQGFVLIEYNRSGNGVKRLRFRKLVSHNGETVVVRLEMTWINAPWRFSELKQAEVCLEGRIDKVESDGVMVTFANDGVRCWGFAPFSSFSAAARDLAEPNRKIRARICVPYHPSTRCPWLSVLYVDLNPMRDYTWEILF